ncbi:MAG: hydrogenase maturation peptidase HycI [Candidatus Omnitrophota bacterium]
MRNLQKQLECRITGKCRVAILGVGSEIRGDDAAGMLVAKSIQKHIKIKRKKNIEVFLGETAPENLTGEIKKFKPTHLLIVDSAEMGKKTGEFQLFGPEEVKGISFCTHQLPVKIMIDYLKHFIDCDIAIIGIQPKHIAFNTKPSKEIISAVKCLTGVILETLNIR